MESYLVVVVIAVLHDTLVGRLHAQPAVVVAEGVYLVAQLVHAGLAPAQVLQHPLDGRVVDDVLYAITTI